MDSFKPLLGTTLVLAAHPDDEVIACGALMQSMQRAVVVFLTDGAPRNPNFWNQYGSRQAYADVRRQEARQALSSIGAWPVFLVDRVEGGIADQELFQNLAPALLALEKVIDSLSPDCILAPAYEGGHPDHDAACFIASLVGLHAAIPVWESPLYHTREDGSRILQTFAQTTGKEQELRADTEAVRKKADMLRIYRSQGLALDGFRADVELFRPIAEYDFREPPLPWKLNYEQWGWPINGEQVAAAFSEYLRQCTLPRTG